MSDSNDRFGRRSAQGDKTPAEPVLSFTPRSDSRRARDDSDDHAGPRLGRGAKKSGPTIDTADRPLHLSEDASRSGGAFGWLVLVVVVAVVGAGYAWHVYTPGTSSSAPVQGYTTPAEPASNTAATTPTSPPPAQALGAAGQITPTPTAPVSEAATQTIGTAPTPKSLPPSPPEPPRKTISDAAAEHPLTTTTPPAAATPATPPPNAKPAAPRKDSSLDLPKPRAAATPAPPMPNLPPPTQAATPAPAPTQQAPTQQAIAVPQTSSGPAATGAPQPLGGAAAPPGQSTQSFNLTPFLRPQAPASTTTAPTTTASAPAATATPVPGTNSVTVNGITYVDGQQPQALGTINAPTPDTANAPTSLAPTLPPAQPANTARPYTPSDSSAPLPNDVIIGPNGQMSVPSGQ